MLNSRKRGNLKDRIPADTGSKGGYYENEVKAAQAL